MFRTILISTVSSIALASVAMASDLPSRKTAPAPAPVYAAPIFTWTGFYVGAQIGGGWYRSKDYSVVSDDEPGISGSGVIGGVHAGYNMQFSSIVAGLEADIEGTSLSKTYDPNLQFSHYTPGDQIHSAIPWQGSLRGRLGFAIDRALIYATGGLAFAEIHNSYRYPPFPPGNGDSFSNVRAGWTIGGGAEYALTSNWIGRLEYRYTDFGSENLNTVNWFTNERNRITEQSVLVGVSYKF